MNKMTEKVMDCLKVQNIIFEYDEKLNMVMIKQSGKYIELNSVVNILHKLRGIECSIAMAVDELPNKMAVYLIILEHSQPYIALIYYNLSYQRSVDDEA